MYSKTVCGQCLYVKSELKQKGISYEEINIDQHKEVKEELIRKGFLSRKTRVPPLQDIPTKRTQVDG